MAVRDIDEKVHVREVVRLDHEADFNRVWMRISPDERAAIEAEIHRRLDEFVSSPNPNWESIMNTSIEGGQLNPNTGVRGDWTGTVFEPTYVACAFSEEQPGMFFGNVYKKMVIEHSSHGVGIRFDLTFPSRGVRCRILRGAEITVRNDPLATPHPDSVRGDGSPPFRSTATGIIRTAHIPARQNAR
jgi:hypothetical protein